MIELSKKAREDLKVALVTDVGREVAESFTEEELNNIGGLLLTILMESLKIRD